MTKLTEEDYGTQAIKLDYEQVLSLINMHKIHSDKTNTSFKIRNPRKIQALVEQSYLLV
jgi:hypothetical protein